jgi:hypothetical protein
VALSTVKLKKWLAAVGARPSGDSDRRAACRRPLEEMLTVIRLGLPDQLRRSLCCTNAIESLIAMLRQLATSNAGVTPIAQLAP